MSLSHVASDLISHAYAMSESSIKTLDAELRSTSVVGNTVSHISELGGSRVLTPGGKAREVSQLELFQSCTMQLSLWLVLI